MFLHVGSEIIVPLREVIYIGDIKSIEEGEATKEFLEIAREEGFLRDISDGKPKSFVVTTSKVFCSSISSVTLLKRAKQYLDMV